jgi:hypothetical protein
LPIENDVRIARDDKPFPVHDRVSLAPRVLDDEPLGVSLAQLFDSGDDDLELGPELAEDLPPLGRPGS